jgi:hypothetical protein
MKVHPRQGLRCRSLAAQNQFEVNLEFAQNIFLKIGTMAAPRLPFLWPILFRPLKASRAAPRTPIYNAPASRSLTTTTQGPVQRYGKAHEPAPHLRDKETPREAGESIKTTPEKTLLEPVNPEVKSAPEPVEEEEEEETPTTTPSTPSAQPTPIRTTPELAPSTPVPDAPLTGEPKPLETVLHMPSPAEEEQRKPPHLKTPPYVHHFDTYGLVKDLAKSGFSEEQAVTVMKAVRGILADNMELARDGLVSKSNVENETYLFRAACSELKTEVGNNRKSETEKMRTERTQVQHELDILNQRLTQETGSLKDELKGLFDDRKMAVRQEQRTMDTKVCFAPVGVQLKANKIADSGTQLQDHCCIELGRAKRGGILTLDSYAASSTDCRHFRIHALRNAALLELCQPSGGR